jgi:uncharacterized protein YndB with AHSA1/START domain
MMPTEFEPHVGGAVTFHMGPEAASHGQVTAFEPNRRVEYEEDWATLMGHPGADVTPLVTEFLVEARSGGSCVVRVVTSAFGTGADWENEFWQEMSIGWAPMLDNLRVYLTYFPGQQATTMWTAATFACGPESAVAVAHEALGISGSAGDQWSAHGASGTVERSIDRHFLLRIQQPVDGLLSFFSYDNGAGSGLHMVGYLFSEDAADYVAREQSGWQAWLDQVASSTTADTTTA